MLEPNYNIVTKGRGSDKEKKPNRSLFKGVPPPPGDSNFWQIRLPSLCSGLPSAPLTSSTLIFAHLTFNHVSWLLQNQSVIPQSALRHRWYRCVPVTEAFQLLLWGSRTMPVLPCTDLYSSLGHLGDFRPMLSPGLGTWALTESLMWLPKMASIPNTTMGCEWGGRVGNESASYIYLQSAVPTLPTIQESKLAWRGEAWGEKETKVSGVLCWEVKSWTLSEPVCDPTSWGD